MVSGHADSCGAGGSKRLRPLSLAARGGGQRELRGELVFRGLGSLHGVLGLRWQCDIPPEIPSL